MEGLHTFAYFLQFLVVFHDCSVYSEDFEVDWLRSEWRVSGQVIVFFDEVLIGM